MGIPHSRIVEAYLASRNESLHSGAAEAWEIVNRKSYEHSLSGISYIARTFSVGVSALMSWLEERM